MKSSSAAMASVALLLFFLALPGCSLRAQVECNGEAFDAMDEPRRLACLESGDMQSPPGNVNLSIAQIHLLRYERNGFASTDEQEYRRYSDMARSSRFASVELAEDAITLLNYYDALLTYRTKRTANLGDKWLDVICPQSEPGQRFMCHGEQLSYWITQADDGSRFENEALYLAFRGLHERYGEAAYKSIEIAALGFLDLEAAREEFHRIDALGQMERPIVVGYCSMLKRRKASDETLEAIVEAGCGI